MYSPADKRGGGTLLRYITAFIIVFAAAGCGIAIAQSDLVKRGDYLVNGILTCGNCHSPKGPAGDNMQKAFSGGLSWDEPPFKVTAPNITDKRAITEGISRDGSRLKPPIGYHYYSTVSPDDLDAVVAYLRTVPARE
jgi:mono/diheme cytochrome c family protein